MCTFALHNAYAKQRCTCWFSYKIKDRKLYIFFELSSWSLKILCVYLALDKSTINQLVLRAGIVIFLIKYKREKDKSLFYNSRWLSKKYSKKDNS